MITGVRTIELRAALWSKVDLDNAIWEISAERMKMRRSHLVPLSHQALDLLSELKIMTGIYCYISPGRNDPNKSMSEASINQVIKRIGYCGSLTDMGLGTQCRPSPMSKVSTVRGLKSNWLMWMKILSVVPIIMQYIIQCGKYAGMLFRFYI